MEKANLRTIRETRLNICSRSEMIRGEEVWGTELAVSSFYRASYEISEAISDPRERIDSSRVAMERQGMGFVLRGKEIIGDTVLDPLVVRPFEIAILSNPPRILPANGKCSHISVPAVMDIVGWW